MQKKEDPDSLPAEVLDSQLSTIFLGLEEISQNGGFLSLGYNVDQNALFFSLISSSLDSLPKNSSITNSYDPNSPYSYHRVYSHNDGDLAFLTPGDNEYLVMGRPRTPSSNLEEGSHPVLVFIPTTDDLSEIKLADHILKKPDKRIGGDVALLIASAPELQKVNENTFYPFWMEAQQKIGFYLINEHKVMAFKKLAVSQSAHQVWGKLVGLDHDQAISNLYFG